MTESRGKLRAVAQGVISLLIIGALVSLGVLFLRRQPGHAHASAASPDLPHVILLSTNPDVLRLPADYDRSLHIETVEVRPAPPPLPLRLPGTLMLDSNKLGRVHSLFSGEVVALGEIETPAGRRPLAYGDTIRKGQELARIWSKDVGEKKSELVDALSKLQVDKNLLDRYLQLEKGIIAERSVNDARRNYEADLIAVARAERTLRSWRLTEPEIEAVRKEAEKIRKNRADKEDDRTWAEITLRAPMAGVIVEKNVTPGDVIDPTVVLFQIVDTGRVQVLANAYEEDLPLLQKLPAGERRWKVSLQTAGGPQVLDGYFEQIGQIIDTSQRTASVIGWLSNDDKVQLKAGQFISAQVELPADRNLVSIPSTALIEEGDSARVMVCSSSDGREFTPRKVAVVTRGRSIVLVRSRPNEREAKEGMHPLALNERVISHGNLELAAELAALKASPHSH